MVGWLGLFDEARRTSLARYAGSCSFRVTPVQLNIAAPVYVLEFCVPEDALRSTECSFEKTMGVRRGVRGCAIASASPKTMCSAPRQL